jgi:tetratricopeptide (TPR) repeat protein
MLKSRKQTIILQIKRINCLGLLVALICVKAVAQINPNDPPMVQHTLQGDEYVAQGMLEPAINEYEKALAAGAGSAPFLNRLGEMYLYAERFDDALKILHTSLAEDAGQLSVLSKISEVFLAKGLLDSAIYYVDQARVKAPESAPIFSSLGFLYLQAGQFNMAKTNLDKALAIDPNSAEAHRFMGFYYTQIDSVDKALTYYRTLAELVPADVEAHNNIAFLLAQDKKYVLALKAYERAKKIAEDPLALHAINLNIEAIRAIMDGKMRARYILVESNIEARKVLEQLEQGLDFGVLAGKFSKAPNAQDGGDVGFFGTGDLMVEFEEAILNLEIGQISEPISLPGGIWIIQRLN